LKDAGRLVAQSVGDQFVFTNIIPEGMSRGELYDGYRRLLERLYSYGNYRRRVMQLLLHKGKKIETKIVASREDLRIFFRVLWNCILKGSPRRAWMTVSLMAETLLRRPRALREAITLALIHKHLYEYMRDTCRRLEEMARELGKAPEATRTATV
jgi:hypothetical protein